MKFELLKLLDGLLHASNRVQRQSYLVKILLLIDKVQLKSGDYAACQKLKMNTINVIKEYYKDPQRINQSQLKDLQKLIIEADLV